MSEAGRAEGYNKQLRPGSDEDRDEEYAGNDKRRRLGDAENAIVMFLPVIVVMEGKDAAQIDAKKERAQG